MSYATPWAWIAEGFSAGFFSALLIHYLVLTVGPGFITWLGDV